MSEIELRAEIERRQKAEESQQLLIAELHHRVKNTLSTVQALIALNLRASPTLETFRSTIGGRIESLAKTHTLLTAKRWHAVSFRDILSSELAPYQEVERVSLAGPDFELEAEPATSAGMIIHELTTNAAKYGALSLPHGSIAIDWTIDAATDDADPMLALTWHERGGPQVQPAHKKGFGSILIERLVVSRFAGTAAFDFAHDGLIFRAAFRIPIAS
jgi:two-component sensor histidine kinase